LVANSDPGIYAHYGNIFLNKKFKYQKSKFIIKVIIVNQKEIIAVLSHSEAEAKSLREIAQAMGLETSSYAGWIKAERGLSSTLRKLMKWGFVVCIRRQNVNGHRFWYNLYWKNEITANEWSFAEEIVSEQS
jgi:hypothetical protein